MADHPRSVPGHPYDCVRTRNTIHPPREPSVQARGRANASLQNRWHEKMQSNRHKALPAHDSGLEGIVSPVSEDPRNKSKEKSE